MTADYSNPIPPRVQSLIGQKFNRLAVLAFVEMGKRGARWKCLCDCGNTVVVYGGDLRRNNTKSCGCLWLEAQHNRAKVKTRAEKRMYRTWINMRVRCYNKNNKNYSSYGGRGIKVCDRWVNSFAIFYADMGDPPTTNHTLDRVDNDGPYSPNNCRWATQKEQMNNTRRNKPTTINGETKNLMEWIEAYGANKQTVLYRLRGGWGVEDALTIPKGQRHKNATMVTIGTKTANITTWIKEMGIKKQTVFYRIRKGWSAERALTTPVKPRNLTHPKWTKR